MRQRNVAMCVVLSIVTCGIYGIYWIYCIADDIYHTNDNMPTTPGITTLLFLVTCHIYAIYTSYKWGEAMQQVADSRGLGGSDRAILYLVLSIFGLDIINLALIQSDLNKLTPQQ